MADVIDLDDRRKGWRVCTVECVHCGRRWTGVVHPAANGNVECPNCRLLSGEVKVEWGELECYCGRQFSAPLEAKAGARLACPGCDREYVGVEDNAHGHWEAVDG